MPTGHKDALTHQMAVKAFGDVPHGWQEIICNVDELGCFQPVTDEGGLTRECMSLSKSTPNDGHSRRFTPTANSNATGARAGFVPGSTIRTRVITSSDGRVGSFCNVVFLKPGVIKNDAGVLFLTVNGFTGGGNNPAVKNHGFIVLARAAACQARAASTCGTMHVQQARVARARSRAAAGQQQRSWSQIDGDGNHPGLN